MEQSISKILDRMDENFNQICKANVNNEAQHAEFRKIIKILIENDSKIAKRVDSLEKWKDNIEGGLFAV